MKAFLTGSRAFGKPREHSDYDVVVRMDEEEAFLLIGATGHEVPFDYGPHSISLKFGMLNLVVCLTDEAYAVWGAATAEAKKKKPISRPAAIEIFRAQIKKSLA